MKKQPKQLLAMVILLAVLTAGYLGIMWYNQYQSTRENQETEEKIVSVSTDEIVKLSYVYEGITYDYEKTDGVWQYVQEPDWSMNQLTLENMVDNFTIMTAKNTITGVTDKEQYGLAEPERSVTFATAQESHTFQIGDYNNILSAYYICRPGEDTVYTVTGSVVTAMNKAAEDMREEPEEEGTADSTEESTD